MVVLPQINGRLPTARRLRLPGLPTIEKQPGGRPGVQTSRVDFSGDGFEWIEIDSSKGNPHGIKRIAHSVVTNDLVDEEGHPTREALDRVLELFRERLLEPPEGS